jgi:parallel beta-helix repeat protein
MKNNLRLYPLSLIISIIIFSCSKDSQILNLQEEQINDEETINENEQTPDGQVNTSSYTFDEPQVSGNTFYLDPVNGSINGDGSETNPWSGLQEVIENQFIETYKHETNNDNSSPIVLMNQGAPVKGGDRLILKNGYHGQLEITNFYFNDWLTIEGAPGEKPTLARLHLNGLIKNVYLKNLNIIKESYQGAEPYWQAADLQRNNNSMIYIASSSFFGKASNVKIKGCTIKTAESVSNWSRQDWEDKFANGIYLRTSENVEVVNSTFENIGFGIIADYFANKATIVNTSIKNYCRDGVRLTAHDFHFEGNQVEGVVNINTSADSAINFHYDAFQAFSRDENDHNAGTGNGVIRNAVIRGNSFIGASDLPLDNGFLVDQDVQGIGCFDGFFDNFIIENNIVSVSHHHGITLLGATNATIANNTVIDSDPTDDLFPWIRIANHKNGNTSKDCTLANNIATQGVHTEGDNVIEKNNHIVGTGNQNDIYSLFVDPDNYDFHLLNNDMVNQNVIDAGTILNNIMSSTIDKDGQTRKDNPDLGAFEMLD